MVERSVCAQQRVYNGFYKTEVDGFNFPRRFLTASMEHHRISTLSVRGSVNYETLGGRVCNTSFSREDRRFTLDYWWSFGVAYQSDRGHLIVIAWKSPVIMICKFWSICNLHFFSHFKIKFKKKSRQQFHMLSSRTLAFWRRQRSFLQLKVSYGKIKLKFHGYSIIN